MRLTTLAIPIAVRLLGSFVQPNHLFPEGHRYGYIPLAWGERVSSLRLQRLERLVLDRWAAIESLRDEGGKRYRILARAFVELCAQSLLELYPRVGPNQSPKHRVRPDRLIRKETSKSSKERWLVGVRGWLGLLRLGCTQLLCHEQWPSIVAEVDGPSQPASPKLLNCSNSLVAVPAQCEVHGMGETGGVRHVAQRPKLIINAKAKLRARTARLLQTPRIIPDKMFEALELRIESCEVPARLRFQGFAKLGFIMEENLFADEPSLLIKVFMVFVVALVDETNHRPIFPDGAQLHRCNAAVHEAATRAFATEAEHGVDVAHC